MASQSRALKPVPDGAGGAAARRRDRGAERAHGAGRARSGARGAAESARLEAEFWARDAVVASVPLVEPGARAAVIAAVRHPCAQILFGFEAQLRALVRLAEARGTTLLLAPAPELFSAADSFAAFRRLGVSVGAAERLLHVRLGMARHARLLKQASNVILTGESHTLLPMGPPQHPFGSGDRVPAGFIRQLVYFPEQSPLSGLDGHKMPIAMLDDGAVAADLLASGIAGTPPGAIPRLAAGWVGADDAAFCAELGLEIGSFAEFSASSWRETWRGAERGGVPHSLDWRRAVTLAGAASDRPERLSPLLLPWNVANPASIVPSLIERLCRAGRWENRALRLVVFPFNESWETAGTVAGLIQRLRAARSEPATLRTMFLARLRADRAAALMRHIFPLAWVEGGDPECALTLARLAALGVPAVLVAPPPNLTLPRALMPRFSILADEESRHDVLDAFGARLFMVPSLSARAVAALIGRSREEIARAAPPALLGGGGSTPGAARA